MHAGASALRDGQGRGIRGCASNSLSEIGRKRPPSMQTTSVAYLVLGVLRHVADELCGLPIIELAYRLAEHGKFARAFAMRGDRGFAVAQKRGFAAAGRADKQLERPLGDAPIERADRGARCLRIFRWRVGEFERLRLDRYRRCSFLARPGFRLAKRRGALGGVCRTRGLSVYRSHVRLSFASRIVGSATSSTYGI